MTKRNLPGITEDELNETLHAWMDPGARSLSEPALARSMASVHATRQVPAWRTWRGMALALRTMRFAGITAAVVLIAAAALVLGTRSFRNPGVVGAPATTAAASPSPATVPTPSTPATSSPVVRATPAVTTEVLSGTVKATGATYDVRYAHVAGLADPAAAAAINKVLLDQADATVRDFTSGIGTDPQAGPDQPTVAQADFTVAYGSPDLLSLRITTYTMPSGAAHGSTVLTTYTFDAASGRRIGLVDLFLPGSGYMDALVTEARAQLRATLSDWVSDSAGADWLTTGTAPTADNYAAWAITPGGLEITFSQYQVAPYAAGMPVVTIPATHLAGLIDPTGPLTPIAAIPLPSVTVTLGIYSGRPDPAWTLTDVQVAALVGQLDSLPVATGTAPQDGLGYHGFTILVQRAGQPDQGLMAYRGAVSGPGDAPGTYRADAPRAIESALLDTGRPRLAAAEVAMVEADLARQ